LEQPFKECYKPNIPDTLLSALFLARRLRTTATAMPAEMRVAIMTMAVEIGNKLKNPTMTEMTISRPGNPAGLV
jgi:hypothetical protein